MNENSDFEEYDTKGVRLSKSDIKLLEDEYGSFTNAIRDFTKQKRENTQKQRKATKTEKLFSGLLALVIGILFLFYVPVSGNFIAWAIVFGIGMFACAVGLYSIFAGFGFNPFSYFLEGVTKRGKR